MRTLLIAVLLLTLAGCAKKEWSKEYLVKKCNKELGKQAELNSLINKEQLAGICDCVAGKMLSRYKSESEADKDEAGAKKIGEECALEVLQK